MNQTITLPQTVFKRLEKISLITRHTPEAFIRKAVKERLDYEEWLAQKLAKSEESIKEGKTYSEKEFWAQLEKVRNARKKAA